MSLSLSGDGTVTGVTAIGDVSSTELGYLDGVTSALQTQINTKADASTQGLVLIDEESFSGAASVSLNNVFSATHLNYLIALNVTSSSADLWVNLRLRSSGADDSGTNYTYQYLDATSTTVTANRVTENKVDIARSDGTDIGAFAMTTIFRPFLTSPTHGISQAVQRLNSSTGTYIWNSSFYHSQSTSYDGFTYLLGGTFTGSVRVYGYKGA